MEQLIYGADAYLANQEYQKAKNQYESPKVFYEFDQEAYEACFQMDLFTETSGIFVRVSELKKNEYLEQYLAAPCPSTDLYVYADKVDPRLKMLKSFENVKYVQRADRKKMEHCIVAYLKKQGAVIKKDACELFMERSGYFGRDPESDMGDILSELNRLSFLSSQITVDLVEREISNQYADAFSLTLLLSNGKYSELLSCVDTLTQKSGFSGIRTLYLLLRNWRGAYQNAVLGKQVINVYVRNDATPRQLVKCMKIIQDGIHSVQNGVYRDKEILRIVILQLIGVIDA